MSYCRRLLWLLVLLMAAGCATTPPPTPPDVDLSPDQPAPPKPKIAHVQPPKPFPTPVRVAQPAPPPISDHLNPNEVWVPLERWCKSCGFGAPHRIGNEGGPVYAFALTNGTVTLRIGSQVATWRGMDYHLGFAPEMMDGHPYVHALDIRKNFMPLLLENPPRLEPHHVIVIDPGHGGTDSGASNVVTGHFEKEYTLDVARRLQALLAANGWTALLTRSNDVALSLSNRVAFADQHNAALFVSLHFNSSFPDRQESGLETYCVTPHGMHSTETRGFLDNPALSFPNNNFDMENMQFAAHVHRELLTVNGHNDRGVRRARFLSVLRAQNRPAFLVEGGFLSNPSEARKIADAAYREKLAEAIARGLADETRPPIHLAAQPVQSVSPKPLPAGKPLIAATNAVVTNGVVTNAIAGLPIAGLPGEKHD